jgi:hypothetical protein
VLACAVAILVGAAPAGAHAIGAVPNWATLLPPAPGDSSNTVPLGFDVCPDGSLDCPARVIDEMTSRWQALDATCDHNAVFALTYLRTTQEFYRTVTSQPDFFSDEAWIDREDANFAEQYFRAFDAYNAGEHVPAAWRIAFDAAASSDETGIGDLLLGMNAHINRDLPFVLASVGLVKPDGTSRKPDHDKVNVFLERVIDPLQVELAQRYDPLFKTTDAEPSPFDETLALQFVDAARENAWRNAERLVNARTPAQRQLVASSIEAEAAAIGRTVRAANTLPGYGPRRDAYCSG